MIPKMANRPNANPSSNFTFSNKKQRKNTTTDIKRYVNT